MALFPAPFLMSRGIRMSHPPLHEAPVHVQLAVDLIYLLEQQPIANGTVLQALAIVQQDFAKRDPSLLANQARLEAAPVE